MSDAARDTLGKSRIEHRGCEDGVSGCEAGTDDKCGRELCLQDKIHKNGGNEPGKGHYRTKEHADRLQTKSAHNSK